jgi:hypothetical protein
LTERPADLILAACDVEGNFLVVKVLLSVGYAAAPLTNMQAYNYTTLLSCMLLDACVRRHRTSVRAC